MEVDSLRPDHLPTLSTAKTITELLTFLHSNNINLAAIQETKLTNKTTQPKTLGWSAVRIDNHKNKGDGLLMPFKDTIPFVDCTAALPQSADPHLEQQGISITMPNHQLLHIHNIYIPRALLRCAQRIDSAPPQQQLNVAHCWGY